MDESVKLFLWLEMNNDLLNILGLSFIGSIAGLIGGVLFLLNKKFARILSMFAIPFAAGILLGVSLLHLIPESVEELGHEGYLVTLIAFIFSFLLEEYLVHLHHHEEKEHTLENHASAPLIIIGDSIHNFIDGVTIAASYLTNPSFGVVVTLATFLHETPHEIGDFGVLMSKGFTRAKTLKVNFFSALATFPGALFVYFFAFGSHRLIGVLLAISAGIFLYLGASDFVPEIGEGKKGLLAWKKFLLFILGSLIMYLLTKYSVGH